MKDAVVDGFTPYRQRLFGIAYRMLASTADADDIVQTAYVRWHTHDTTTLQSPEAWLVTVVTRLCIDRLRELKQERLQYVGDWLPEPLHGALPAYAESQQTPSPGDRLEHYSDLSFAYLLLLERLTPEERAAILLRDVFDYDYPDIAAILDKNDASCRQLIHRARTHATQQKRKRLQSTHVSHATHLALLEKFLAATQTGNHDALLALLAEDARLTADSGGKVSSLLKPLEDRTRIARFISRITEHFGAAFTYRTAIINGHAAIIRFQHEAIESVQLIETDGHSITDVYLVRNPDKLARIQQIISY
jgi:RNA polymerase sigma factor (sigma-70 family)